MCWADLLHKFVVCGLQGAFDAYAMGDFPFPTDYMTGEGQGELPAWPMRVACERMSSIAPSAAAGAPQAPQLGRKGLADIGTTTTTTSSKRSSSDSADTVANSANVDLLERLQSAASILYNASGGTVSCYSLDLAGPAAGSAGECIQREKRFCFLQQASA